MDYTKLLKDIDAMHDRMLKTARADIGHYEHTDYYHNAYGKLQGLEMAVVAYQQMVKFYTKETE